MSRVCDINGTKALKGRKIHRRGLAKKKGGIGQHVTATTRRYFLPNLKHQARLGAGAEEIRHREAHRPRAEDRGEERCLRHA